MNRLFRILIVSVYFLVVSVSNAQDIPTLVPPTPVPSNQSLTVSVQPLTESSVARIVNDGKLRVGILFNERPFAELNIRGDVSGFDADLARSITDAWGTEIEFIQVTRQNGLEFLQNREVDILMGAQVHRRSLDADFEFSQTYLVGRQAMMVRADDAVENLAGMAGRRVGYVLQSDGEQALNAWQTQIGISVEAQAYYTLDDAFVALDQGEVDGVIDRDQRLLRVSSSYQDKIRLLDEPVFLEPYAIVMLRHDVNLRNLINKTLQYLLTNGRLFEVHNANFPGQPFTSEDYLIPWAGLNEEGPTPIQYATDVPVPSQSLAQFVTDNGTLRVAGLAETPPSSTARANVETLSRELFDRIAERLGVTVEYLPNSVDNAIDLVASGQADIALAVEPNWDMVDQVDFTNPYIVHGDRLLVQSNSQIETFRGLQGIRTGIIRSDAGAEDRATFWANSIQIRIRTSLVNEGDVAFQMLVDNNIEAAFGDSLFLIPHILRDPDSLRFTDRQYSTRAIAMAIPRNDLDFRLLLEYELQALIADGTLASLSTNVTVPNETQVFDIWTE